MIVTRETDYAIRIMWALASGEMRPMREIVQEQMLPQAFAYKILQKLVHAGYIEVMRGSTGGCRLIVGLDDVSLYDLIVVIDGLNTIAPCAHDSYKCDWRDANGDCEACHHLQNLQSILDTELQSLSLATLIGDSSAK